ncbi:MAG: hypothetical protein OEY20_17070 [Gemmatimonadota bacterium]|nr:hypothetical protein [Acidimicrobiia bacterium]MDH5198956.1 hypothetical protein [Gemmatimonadota bacterium]
MDTALVITWKVPLPGRERRALEFAATADAHWQALAAEGRCTTPEWYFMPDGWALWMVKGQRRVIEDIMAEETTSKLLTRGFLLLDGWQYRLAKTASGAEQFMGDYGAAAGQLGIL